MTVPREMQAMVLERAGAPLRAASLQVPEPGPGEILIKVAACGVCRTDLHIVDGELAAAEAAARARPRDRRPRGGARAGRRGASPSATASACRGWAGPAARCGYCRSDQENLCDHARFTGYQIDGGYAEFTRRRRALLLPHARRSIAMPRPRRCSAPG